VENPLLRFYPSDDNDEEDSNEIPQMMSDEGAKHERSSPVTEFFNADEMAGSASKMCLNFPAIFVPAAAAILTSWVLGTVRVQ
jgi:hypothetical protein